MATFILKTEPSTYSFADLQREKRAVWDGISNAAALASLRKARRGDEALIYHTGDEKAIVGLARMASDAYEDPKQPGTNAEGEPRVPVVDLTPLRVVNIPVTLAQLKADRRFAAFPLVRQPRLSVIAVPPELDTAIRTMAGL